MHTNMLALLILIVVIFVQGWSKNEQTAHTRQLPSLPELKTWSAPAASVVFQKRVQLEDAPDQVVSRDQNAHSGLATSIPMNVISKTASPFAASIVCTIGDSFDAGIGTPFTNATLAINNFCTDTIAQVRNPMHPEPFLQDKFVDITAYPQRFYLSENVTISIIAMFADTVGMTGIQGCGDDASFVVQSREIVCRETLQQIVQQCVGDNTKGKTGGFAVERSSGYGCVVWQIWGYK